MEPDPTRRVEELMPDLAPAATADPGSCPADDVLLGLAQGRLPEGVAEGVRAHLAACDDCRALAVALAGEPLIAKDEPGAGSRAARPRRWPMLAAAALVAGLGIALLARELGTDRSASTEERMVAAAEALAASDPDLFGTFEVLGPEDRRAPVESPRERGAIWLPRPRHTVLHDRPSFFWEDVPGASTYRVSVLDDEGREIWSRDHVGNVLAYPEDAEPLRRGAAYLWTVETEGALGPVRGRGTFRVADMGTARRYDAARRRILATAAREDVDLLSAHYAIRLDLLHEAWRLLESAPRSPVADETLAYVARRMGVPIGE